ncbi:MAG TPA: NUDIX hydrolase [Oscillatoriales cyanobacterium M59_W2019_021]|nr:NUDIX hydrolase [Oscillatoriales cyanobacterium M4454_W2019_049]HIK50545.1 NUDIX hydrolase [Oscillatoriales cyanobacterium M59_W2019_021]
MNDSDELLDIVDASDRPIGRRWRSQLDQKGIDYYCRVVNAFLINPEGKLWLPRRTANKRRFPLCLDMSMGGYVVSGESYDEACQRELQEELNLEIDRIADYFLGYLTPVDDGVSAFMKVYEIPTDTTPDYNRNDFIEGFWWFPQEAFDRLRSGEPAKNDLLKLLEKFYGSMPDRSPF